MINLDLSFKKAQGAITENFEAHAPQKIMSLIDYTHLAQSLPCEEWNTFVSNAVLHQVAAICVYPEELDRFQNLDLKRASVINFPSGNQDLTTSLNQIESLKRQSLVDEIDYVINFKAYIEGHQDKALADIESVFKLTKDLDLTLKVILETGAFDSISKIYDLSLGVIDAGADFIKTSTGKIEKGASPEAVFAMLKAIETRNTPTGIKCSGGIRHQDEACLYINLSEFILNKKVDASWFRLGASQLLVNLAS